MMVSADNGQDTNQATFRSGVATWVAGTYLICHSGCDRPNAECFLPKGLMLPHCPMPACEVTFRLLHLCSHVSQKHDFDPP